MSPSEHDLRNALRHGENGSIDADRIIAAGRQVRARRRAVVLSAAAVVVVAGAVTTGVTLTSGNGTSTSGVAVHQYNADRRAEGGAAAPSAAGGGGLAGGVGTDVPKAAPSDIVVGTCPPAPPHFPTPAGGDVGADGALFPKPVTSVLLCEYTPDSVGVSPKGAVVTQPLAGELVRSLEDAPRKRRPEMCPNYEPANPRTLVVIGRDANGSTVSVVTAPLDIPACAVVVSNGRAIRYDWSPPASMDYVLRTLRPAAGRSHGPVEPGTSSTSR